MTPFVHELAQSIRPAGESKSLYEAWLARARDEAPKQEGKTPAEIVTAPPVGALRVSVTVSGFSMRVSSMIGTVNVLLVSPTAKLSVPLVAV